MAKPKYTPDPPPDVQGMPFDQAFPLFMDWKIRQENRQEDWWPKDYEARIQELERLAPYCIGIWPIVDYSSITFESVAEIVDATTACDVSWAYSSTAGVENYGIGTNWNTGGVSIDRDAGYLIIGGGSSSFVTVYRDDGGGVWTLVQTINYQSPIQNNEGFGYSVTHSQGAGIMLVGAPYTDQSGTTTGTVAYYTGSNSTSWTYGGILEAPDKAAGQGFGTGVEISEDGLVAAIGAVGSGTDYVYVFDITSGPVFTFRNKFTDSAGSVRFGEAIALSNDGNILIASDPYVGAGGAQGRVTVWDNVSGTFIKRQTINKLNLGDAGIPGNELDPNNNYFGSGVKLSEDNRSLFITFPAYSDVPAGDQLGLILVYKLNTGNEYEYCDYIIGAGAMDLHQMDVAVSGSSGTIAVQFQIIGAGPPAEGRVDLYEPV